MIYATGIGGVQTLLNQHDVLREKGAGRVSPFMVPMLMANAAGGHIAMHFGLTGPNYCTVSACSSSNHAIGEAMRLIRDGYVDLAIAGGSEAATIPLTVAAFAQMTALTKNPDPETASRPFDADRNGFVLSEGGCALILESEEHARGPGRPHLLRGRRLRRERRRPPHHRARPEGVGCGARDDAGRSPTPARTRRRSTYVNAHGTSTPLNDAAETAAIKTVLGEHAHTGGRVVDEVDDGAHARRGRRGRGARPARSRSPTA